MVYYKLFKKCRRMPMILGSALVAVFIWFGENIGTLTTAWTYPHQQHGWQMVRFAKYGSWFLLMIVSFVLISFTHKPETPTIENAKIYLALLPSKILTLRRQPYDSADRCPPARPGE